jgi:hypothetical protein
MERKRWYKLGLKQKKAVVTKEQKAEARKLKIAKEKLANAEDEDSEDEAVEDDEDEEEIILAKTGERIENSHNLKNDLFGYIDENGNVVYLNIDDEEFEDGENPPAEKTQEIKSTEGIEVEAAPPVIVSLEALEINDIGPIDIPVVANKSKTQSLKKEELGDENESDDDDEANASSNIALPQTEQEKTTFFGRYFEEQTRPCPRINPCIMTRFESIFYFISLNLFSFVF